MAAAPSETSEQSVLRSGAAIKGNGALWLIAALEVLGEHDRFRFAIFLEPLRGQLVTEDAILVGQARYRQFDARRVDALAGFQKTGNGHLAAQGVAALFLHGELDFAVADDQTIARLGRVDEVGMRQMDHRRLAGARRQHDLLAPGQHHAAGLHVPDTQLGALQVAQDSQQLALFAGDLAEHLHRLRVAGMIAVGTKAP